MIPPNLKSLGLKDMADEQVEAMMKVAYHAIALSHSTMDHELIDEVLDDVNAMVILFGGQGVTVDLSVDLQP